MKYNYLSGKFPNAILNINNAQTDDSFYSVLQYQPEGDLSYSPSTGVSSSVTENELNALFKLNEGINADLLITPECSIPFSYIKKIIKEKAKSLCERKLWCLCCEGIPNGEFVNYIDEISEDNDFVVINDNNNLNLKKHVNTLWYMFKIQDGKTAIVVQLKTGPMKDLNFDHEANDLSTDDVIQVFDLSVNKTNTFISLICADLMHVDRGELLTEFQGKNLLIFNPQLNPKPTADAFITFRQMLFTLNSNKRTYIGLNWALGTKLNGKDVIEHSGSSIGTDIRTVFGHYNIDKILCDKDALSERRKLHSKGIYYSYNTTSHFNKWSFTNDPHLMFYRIKKSTISERPAIPQTNHEPFTPQIYFFDNGKGEWVISNSARNNSEWLSNIEKDENVPFKCNQEKCKQEGCMMVYNDYFLSLCFGTPCKEEVKNINEVGKRTIIALSKEDKRHQSKKTGRINVLFDKINRNEVPEGLKPMFNNIKFDYNRNCAETGSNELYNINFTDKEYSYKKGIVSILLYDSTEDEVKQIYDSLKKRTKADYQDQILIYYSENGDGYKCYSEPHNITGYKKSNAGYSKDTTSIKRG